MRKINRRQLRHLIYQQLNETIERQSVVSTIFDRKKGKLTTSAELLKIMAGMAGGSKRKEIDKMVREHGIEGLLNPLAFAFALSNYSDELVNVYNRAFQDHYEKNKETSENITNDAEMAGVTAVYVKASELAKNTR
jgi:hypothetical protein